MRFPLHDFTAGAMEVLDLTLVDPDLKGFYGGYATGGNGYLIPYHNGDRSNHTHPCPLPHCAPLA